MHVADRDFDAVFHGLIEPWAALKWAWQTPALPSIEAASRQHSITWPKLPETLFDLLPIQVPQSELANAW